MKSHPEQFRPMLEASKKAFQSGDSSALRARNERIKKTMGDEKYREMTRTRIRAWKSANPAEYAKARQKNRDSFKSPETQRKRAAILKKWGNDMRICRTCRQTQASARVSPAVRTVIPFFTGLSVCRTPIRCLRYTSSLHRIGKGARESITGL